jgi:hypothetical protein
MILPPPLSTLRGYHRTGPLGRLARVALLAIFAGTLYSIVDGPGSARFRNPHILTEPSAWFLHIMMLIEFVIVVGAIASTLGDARRVVFSQIGAVGGLVGSGVVAAIIGQAAFGSVWWFDVLMLAVGCASTALAIVLGTPGCEIDVLRILVARFRRTQPPGADTSACILGLHALDGWERRRTALSRSGDSTAP